MTAEEAASAVFSAWLKGNKRLVCNQTTDAMLMRMGIPPAALNASGQLALDIFLPTYVTEAPLLIAQRDLWRSLSLPADAI